jgi:hypothetical protein
VALSDFELAAIVGVGRGRPATERGVARRRDAGIETRFRFKMVAGSRTIDRNPARVKSTPALCATCGAV